MPDTSRWFGKSVIFGSNEDAATPYMTRYWIGRLRLHIFHRGDQDPDCHDHPWDFWTFPLTSYIEERAVHYDDASLASEYTKIEQFVPAWRLTYRPAEHCHRVLGRATERAKIWFGMEGCLPKFRGDQKPWYEPGPIVTIIWRGRSRRRWGFLRDRDGRWCWTPWKEYVFGGGKSAPCE